MSTKSAVLKVVLIISLGIVFSYVNANPIVGSEENLFVMSPKKEIRKIEKEIKNLDKSIRKLQVTEKALSLEEELINSKARAEATKRKARRNSTRKRTKEKNILENLAAKRAELSLVRKRIAQIENQIDTYHKNISALANSKPSSTNNKPSSTNNTSTLTSRKATLKKEAKQWLGTRYLYGGITKSGVDCSGFTSQVFKKVYGLSIPRSSFDQYSKSKKINKASLMEGDLVFFKINKKRVSHVGIYLGNGEFIHASSSRGVVINKLSENYYTKYFASGGRY